MEVESEHVSGSTAGVDSMFGESFSLSAQDEST